MNIHRLHIVPQHAKTSNQYPTFEIGTLHGKFAGGAFPDALVGANFQDGGSAGCISYGDDLEVYKVLQTDFTV